jgi:hypothetical protein
MHSEKTDPREAPALLLTDDELAAITGAGQWSGSLYGHPFWGGSGTPN